MGIAFGSGIQIALGASGIAVFSSILLGNELSLVFDPLQIAALAAAALVAPLVARGGETNWLEGLQLLVIYLIINVAVCLQCPAELPDRIRLAVHGRQHLARDPGGRRRHAGLIVVGPRRELSRMEPCQR